jgi:hypothetical protein
MKEVSKRVRYNSPAMVLGVYEVFIRDCLNKTPDAANLIDVEVNNFQIWEGCTDWWERCCALANEKKRRALLEEVFKLFEKDEGLLETIDAVDELCARYERSQ